ncbi:MAG: branched-chain amino acid ABC transporter substrate-binding protein [Anaerolineae bacterium]|nr:branched-chain amino acid ABC transporter substrate-binding protein [Anaerolineae bacterium]
MRRKLPLLVMMLVVLVAVTPVLASRVAQEEGVVTFAAGDSVKIGLATDLSNLIPAPGQDIANGAQLAVDEFNEAGGLQGFTVELVVEDDRCVGEDATSVANLFVSDPHIVGVVGHVCSGASIPASEVYQEARIPMVSPSSTAGAFTARGLDVANRVAFNDNIQGVVAARFIFSELGAQRIAVLHDNTSYGEGLASTVAATFEELGGEVITFEVVDPEEQDFRPVLTVLAGEEPDLIYLGGYEAQAALIVQQMAEVGLEDTIFFSDDGVYTATYLELAGDASEGTYVTFGAQVGDPEANEAFDERYEEKFGVAPDELGPFHAQAYDAATVILKALEAVATVDDAGNLSVDREALIEAVRTTEDLEGLSGLITCDENGDCGSATIAVFVAEGGEWVEVEVPEELQVSSES